MPVVASSGYQHTLATLVALVRRRVMKADSDDHWSDALVEDCINDALNELRLLGFEQVAQDSFTSTADQQTWIPSATVWKVISVNYDDEYLQAITQTRMDEVTGGDWDANSGDPDYWFVETTDAGCKVWFDKKMPVGKTVKFWYLRRPQDLTGDDELSGFYKVFSPLVVYKACALLKDSDGDGQESARWDARFERLLLDAEFHSKNPHGATLAPHDPYGWSDPN